MKMVAPPIRSADGIWKRRLSEAFSGSLAKVMRSSADVVVVGGGIVGCSAAAELAEMGADVVLVEKAEIAHGASGRNHGLIFYPLNPITDPLYRVSLDIYRQTALSPDLDIELDEKPVGFVVLVAGEEDWSAARAEAAACQAGGIQVMRLDSSELRNLEPNLSDEFEGGYLINDGYRVDPQALTLALSLRARADGGDVETHTEAKQLITRGGRVAGVATDRGLIHSDVVVVAAGPWAPKLARTAGVELEISGARGWLLLTRPAPPLCRHVLGSAGWHLVDGDTGPAEISLGEYARREFPASPDVGLLIQQNPSGHVLLGGSRYVSTRQEPEGPEVTKEIARRAVAAVPALGTSLISEVRSGVRPVSPDGVPLIGWAPGLEGLFVVGGHGGQGVILGGGSGRLAAQMILKKRPYTDPAPFAIGRGGRPTGVAPASQ
jgi:D-hydroxyproline dehydrogenase subunit beta